MKRSSRETASSSKAPVALNSSALERVCGGLVSNFNRIGSDDSAGGQKPVVVVNGGPTGMW